jgi:hypothetical protein
MNAEQITVTGTALDLQTYASSHFTAQFDVTEGRVVNAQCGSTTVLAVSDFSASIANLRVGATPVAAPADFTAYLGSVTCPQVFQELVSGPITLEANGPLFQSGQTVFDGSIGSWWIEGARVQVTAVAEPGTLALLVLGLAASLASRIPRFR